MLPNEFSIYCNKCECYNIGTDYCFCDECFQKVKDGYLDKFIEFLINNEEEGEDKKYLQMEYTRLAEEYKKGERLI